MIDIAAYGHFDAAGKCLEDALDFVMLVLAFGFDVEVHLGCIAERLEEVQEHLCRHIAYMLAVELGVPHKPGAAAEVQAYLTETIVHWQRVAVALSTAFVAKSAQQAFA